MSLRIRFEHQTGATLAYSIERLSDGTFWDFSAVSGTAHTFCATPAIWNQSLTEGTGLFKGRYTDTYTTTPGAQFTDGAYVATIHDLTTGQVTPGGLVAIIMHSGDDAPVFPAGSGGDPWATALPGSYSSGTAGNILGNRLDAAISTRLATSGYTAPDNTTIGTISSSVGSGLKTELDAVKAKTDQLAFTGGNVNAKTLVCADKTGYALSSAGLDAILPDTASAINARQVLAGLMSLLFGQRSGATGANPSTVLFKAAGDPTTTRITATTDGKGNVTGVTTNLP